MSKKPYSITFLKGSNARGYLCGIHTQSSDVSLFLSLKMERVTVLTSLTYPGHNTQPISAVQSDSQSMWSTSWNAMAQMLYLLHSSFASSRVCVYAYTKNTPGQNTTRSYWITPALFSHSWTSWHIVNSAECAPGHSNLPLLRHWHFAMNPLTIAAEAGKGLPGCFLTFYFSDHLGQLNLVFLYDMNQENGVTLTSYILQA